MAQKRDMLTEAAAADLEAKRKEAVEEKRARGETGYEEFEDLVDVQKIQEILGSHDVSGGKVRLERKGPTDQTFQYLTSLPIEQFDIDHIKKTYGGGDYFARTFRANGQMYKTFQFSIDYRFKGALDADAAKAVAAQPPENQSKLIEALMRSSNDSNMSPATLIKVMEMAQRQQESQTALMLKMMNDSNERQMLMMTKMFEAAKTQTQPIAAAHPPLDFAAAITPIILEMVRKGSSNSPLSESLAAIRELKEVMRGEEREEKEETMLEKVIRALVPAVAPMLAAPPGNGRGAGSREQGAGRSMRRLDPGGVSEAQIRSGASAIGVDMSAEQVKRAQLMVTLFVEQLLNAADRDSDPGTYYDLLCDSLSPEQLAHLKGILTKDDWCARLFNSDARVLQRINWFEELRGLVLSDGVSDDKNAIRSDADLSGAVAQSGGPGLPQPGSDPDAGSGQVAGSNQ